MPGLGASALALLLAEAAQTGHGLAGTVIAAKVLPVAALDQVDEPELLATVRPEFETGAGHAGDG